MVKLYLQKHNINNQIESLIVKSNKIGMFNHIIALDNVTNKHLNSVKDITIKICNKMGMTEEEISFFATCAFLHDIGKILVPPHILQKPTSLTPDEFKIMKNHTYNPMITSIPDSFKLRACA